MKKLLLFIAVLLGSIAMFAQPRSEEQAKQIASEFFNKKPQQKAPMLSVVPQQKVSQTIQKKVSRAKSAPAQQPSSCYIINDEANNRFVIVSADERLYEILGYSDNGCFDAEKAPEGLIELMESYNVQYDYLLSEDVSNAVRKGAHEYGKEIGPLIQSKWAQDSPYNLLCPENKKFSTGENCATGCVATAMAQIMKYYKYPQKGQGGSYRYQMESQGEWLSLNFNSLIFDWDNMLNEYKGYETEAQKNAVANLMYACGVSVSMNYGVDERGQSAAQTPNVPYALIHYFGYNPNTVYYNREYYSDDDWRSIIYKELEASRPILYSGTGTGGHAFVLDGCNLEGKYHFNFGASGTCDGYYELDAIILIDGALNIHNYSYYQDMVCQICPQKAGNHEDVFYSEIFDINDKSVKIGKSVDFHITPICYSSNSTYKENRVSTFSGELGIGLFDEDLNYVTYLRRYSVNDVGIGEGFDIPQSMTFYSYDFKDGCSYYIAPYAKASSSSTVTRIRTKNGKSDYYYANVSNGEVTLRPKVRILPVQMGDYNVLANTEERWNINIWQDSEDSTKYWISNLDPVVAKKGYDYESGWNKVYGYINETHTQLSVPVNQEIGKDIVIKNISGGDIITIQLTEKDSRMYLSIINDIWGSKELSAESEMSRYQYTTIAYGKIDIVDPTPEPTPDPVEKPSIDVSSNTFTLHCGTKGAIIYYTTDDTTPNESCSRYNDKPVYLYHNCTIKAIAFKDGQSSEVATYNVNTFKVETPDIHQEGNNISFTCATEGASIYYDWDGKTRQSGSLEIEKSGVIKVYAEKDGFNKSDVKEQSLVYTPVPNPEPGPDILVIEDNEAGKLSTRISDTNKLSATRLTVSGKINGTDIVFIREMFYYGKLTDLDMENATIVSGGDVYDTTINAVTKDNVVGKYFFENCRQMISIKLPSNAVKIEGSAFSGCKSLKKLDIPASCVEVESMIVSSCDNLEEVNLSDAVQIFPGLAVYSSKNLMRINVSKGNQYFKSVDGVLFSKEGKILVRYPMGKNDESYIIPDDVVTIGKEAFDYAMIANVTIPNTVTTIESSAFENCKNIQTLTIPNSVTTIGESAFKGCDRLDNVTMSSKVSSIESYVFSGCKNLRKFYIGTKVSRIDKLAFFNCLSLQEFDVDENSSFFTAQSGILYTKDMQELVKCPMALYAEEYIVPKGVKVIRAEAFASCTNVKRFYLPETLKKIGECAFEKCEMASIRIPQSVTSIGESAFNNCKNLESFVFPDGMHTIEDMTLHGCKSLTYVYIPENVQSFGMWAISDCPALTMINSKVIDIDKVTVHYDSNDSIYDAFEKVSDKCTWRVPAGGPEGTAEYEKYANLYKAQPWWVSTWKIVIDNELEPMTQKIDFTDAAIRTFCSSNALDFSYVFGLNAYIASGFSAETGDVIMSKVEKVPAKTGLLLIGEAGNSYMVPKTETDYVYSNLLVGVLEDNQIETGFVFNGDLFEAIREAQTVQAGEAYLDIAIDNVKQLNLCFTDTDGIESVQSSDDTGNWHTLQGVRLNVKPNQKGVYINNGRKVLVK